MLKLSLVSDKVTKNTVRFAQGNKNLYLDKEEVTDLGLQIAEGQKISVTIAKAK